MSVLVQTLDQYLALGFIVYKRWVSTPRYFVYGYQPALLTLSGPQSRCKKKEAP